MRHLDEKALNPWKARSPWHVTALWTLAAISLLAMATSTYWRGIVYLKFEAQIGRHPLIWWFANAAFLLLQILLAGYLVSRTKGRWQYRLTRKSGYAVLFLYAAVGFLFDPLIFVELGERGLWITISRTLIIAFMTALGLFVYSLGHEKGTNKGQDYT